MKTRIRLLNIFTLSLILSISLSVRTLKASLIVPIVSIDPASKEFKLFKDLDADESTFGPGVVRIEILEKLARHYESINPVFSQFFYLWARQRLQESENRVSIVKVQELELAINQLNTTIGQLSDVDWQNHFEQMTALKEIIFHKKFYLRRLWFQEYIIQTYEKKHGILSVPISEINTLELDLSSILDVAAEEDHSGVAQMLDLLKNRVRYEQGLEKNIGYIRKLAWTMFVALNQSTVIKRRIVHFNIFEWSENFFDQLEKINKCSEEELRPAYYLGLAKAYLALSQGSENYVVLAAKTNYFANKSEKVSRNLNVNIDPSISLIKRTAKRILNKNVQFLRSQKWKNANALLEQQKYSEALAIYLECYIEESQKNGFDFIPLKFLFKKLTYLFEKSGNASLAEHFQKLYKIYNQNSDIGDHIQKDQTLGFESEIMQLNHVDYKSLAEAHLQLSELFSKLLISDSMFKQSDLLIGFIIKITEYALKTYDANSHLEESHVKDIFRYRALGLIFESQLQLKHYAAAVKSYDELFALYLKHEKYEDLAKIKKQFESCEALLAESKKNEKEDRN